MRSGDYDLHFSAGTYSVHGRATVDRDTLHGADGLHRFAGTVVDGRAHVTSNLDVTIEPDVAHNRHVPAHFSVLVSGVASDAGFSLIGTGPLGLIIALEGVKRRVTTQ